jgi:hypothetical protein
MDPKKFAELMKGVKVPEKEKNEKEPVHHGGAGPHKPVEVEEGKPMSKEKAIGAPPSAPADTVKGDDPEAILGQAQEILKEHNNREAEVPLTSPYWALMNRYRSMPKTAKGARKAGPTDRTK